ncbi:MAG TPA: hypothetical protein VHX38_17385 [Pseudonocardiaceae bacterium]|nr:hypothetical protein [Pseudonocardiaceae bacterium]
MAKKICTKCDGNGFYFDDNGNEVNPCDAPGCGGDGFIETDEDE